METLTPKNVDRLAKAMMQRHGVSYVRAREMLGALRLHLVCGEGIRESAALQAAFLTAINTGKRAFQGGVMAKLPADVELRVPWPNVATLNEVACELGVRHVEQTSKEVPETIFFGNAGAEGQGTSVLCDGWRAVLAPAGHTPTFTPGPDFALGGIFAGAFAVATTFLHTAEITHREIDEPLGISLWRPDLSWFETDAVGPLLTRLPAKLWLLGLGHLGQAYGWTLSLLPFSREAPATIYLQDYDVVESGNWSAGLFCEADYVGRLKTRLCADWLEKRGFHTRLIERPFDESTQRTGNEPRVVLCGFDNPDSRRIIEDAGFELVVDAGLGASLDHFDRIVLRTFPGASQKARDIWANLPTELPTIDPRGFGNPEDECGIVLQEIAGKAISSSFTGACASTLVIAEVLRAIHGGKRGEFMAVQLRDFELPRSSYRDENYQLRVARNGIVPVAV